jgi:DeoR/GlpR family transcriptional regulator of sugar metabolism
VFAAGRAFEYNLERLSTVGRRTHEHPREKAAIARIAARLIMPQRHETARFTMMSATLRARMEEYWNKKHRLVILDSGSTTAAIARQVAPAKTPDANRRLSHLRVLTNGALVHQELNIATCTHGLIFLGGAERFDTGAVAGTLAEQCLDAWALKADLAVIGTTNLNEDMKWCCDHEDEAYIKSRLLDSARVRCLAVDSSKLINPSRGSAFPFAAFSRFMVDIIITDPLIHERHSDEECEQERQNFLVRAHDEAIYVATEPLQGYGKDGGAEPESE